MKISIVIPVYNGAKTIKTLVDKLFEALGRHELEVILIDDGSRDDSHKVCSGIFERHNKSVIYIRLAKNFGEHNAVIAGLNHVTGDYAVIIDDDFQNPPEEIQKLIDTAISGNYDVVYSYYDRKYHSWFRNTGSAFNNLVANFLLDKPKDLYLSSFKCLNRFIMREVTAYKGPFPYIDGLILRSTQNIGKVLVRHDERREGKSGYNIRKLAGLWLNMFTNFSVYPLRLSTILGIAFSSFGAIMIVWAIIEKLFFPGVPAGMTSIFVAILVFSGIQLIMLGLVGEYIGKQFLTNNQTPQFVVRSILSSEKKG